MKKIIISLDHVVGAIMAAYEKEMEIKSSGCSTEQDGRLVVRFSVDSIKRGQLDKLEAAKWLKKCGFEFKYQQVLNKVVLSATSNQSEWLVRIVVSNCLTSAQEKSLTTRMKSIMTSGLRASALCDNRTNPETSTRGRLTKWITKKKLAT